MLYFEHSGYGYSKRLCEDITSWFLLKYFPRHKIEVSIVHRGLKREYVYGYCDISGKSYRPRSFLIELDTYMDKELYAKTLLHELYHVAQWVRGELKLKSCKRYFRGECVEDYKYSDQPHEIFAYWHENLLYQSYLKDRNLTRL